MSPIGLRVALLLAGLCGLARAALPSDVNRAFIDPIVKVRVGRCAVYGSTFMLREWHRCWRRCCPRGATHNPASWRHSASVSQAPPPLWRLPLPQGGNKWD